MLHCYILLTSCKGVDKGGARGTKAPPVFEIPSSTLYQIFALQTYVCPCHGAPYLKEMVNTFGKQPYGIDEVDLLMKYRLTAMT